MRIAGSAFVVTGAASGLGAASARMLAAGGASVVLADLDEAAGRRLEAELAPCARFVATDVTREEDAEACTGAALAAFGELRGIVHCAGLSHAEKLFGEHAVHELSSFARVVEVNLTGSFNMTRFAAQAISRATPLEGGERGVVVFTASTAALEGQVGQSAYAASKGGLAAMTLPLARELSRFGIRVVAIAPGVFDTPLMAGFDPAVRERLAAAVPFPRRLGRPEEYAGLVRHIIENPMLNGALIRLDGALRMAPR